jgi:alpha,alpha-trehalase
VGAPVSTSTARTPDRTDTEPVATVPHVLREYALIADGERGALLGPRGDIAWLCAPRWDSPSVFGALIGGTGEYTVSPTGRFVWGGYYERASLIWCSRWVTTSGTVHCREALAFPGDPHRAVLLRRVIALDAPARVTVLLRPRGDYERTPMSDLRRTDGVWTASVGELRLRWSGAADARAAEDGGALCLDLSLDAGQAHDLVLELADAPLPERPADADAAWQATEAAWRDAVPRLEQVLSPEDTRHSYAVLLGLTSREGGTVAAATTSLPERSEAGRNYDYRYVWIRDQCYAGNAIAACGPHPLLDSAVSVVADRLLEHGDRLVPAYTTQGQRVPDERRLDLPGYPGGCDIVGNQANDQFQLDAFGEALVLFAAAARHDRLDDRHVRAAEAAAAAIERRWQEPDSGIWEIDPQPWTHSRLSAAAGLKAICAAVPSLSRTSERLALAEHIVADTWKHAAHPDGRWQRSPHDPGGDAALLMPPLRGAVSGEDPRTVATLSAYLAELTEHGYAYRFRHDDRPLPEAEGSFLLCGFVVALALHQQGEAVDARAWYERTRSACGPPQLFSEEYDSQQHQMRANLPQAFVHALMIESSARLAQ